MTVTVEELAVGSVLPRDVAPRDIAPGHVRPGDVAPRDASQETSLQDTSVQERASQETSLQETPVHDTESNTGPLPSAAGFTNALSALFGFAAPSNSTERAPLIWPTPHDIGADSGTARERRITLPCPA